jgi:hypothetical protein
MATKKKLLQAVAGIVAGGGDAAEGVSFDGTNDYLSRSSDLTGNADSKTFTFSAWVYKTTTTNDTIYTADGRFRILWDGSTTQATIQGYNSSGTGVVRGKLNIPLNTFVHILVSLNTDSTATRYVYVNDVQQSVNWDIWTTSSVIEFTTTNHYINGRTGYLGTLKGRLAHVYLDYTYRDLSTESNRRLFITDDLKPADGLASLSPILYLPLTDADTAGTNEGTGGDFTVNGVLDTAQRGPNQYNCVASKFASGDALTKTSINETTSTITCSFVTKVDLSAVRDVFGAYDGGSSLGVQLRIYTNGSFGLALSNGNGTYYVNTPTSSFTFLAGVTYHFAISLDTSDSSKTRLFVNGNEETLSFGTFTSGSAVIDGTFWVGGASGANFDNNALGEFYFDTNYIDLATDNPFWDEDANRPKPVRQVLDETGNTPLIAMPIQAGNEGLNLGTGGNFSAVSSPYTGARGGSEYWARSASFRDASNDYVTAGVTTSSTKTISLAFSIKNNETSTSEGLIYFGGSISARLLKLSTNLLRISLYNEASSLLLTADSPSIFSSSKWNTILMSIDLQNDIKTLYVNGQSTSFTGTATDDFAYIPYIRLGYAIQDFYGDIGPVYYSTEYIDFTDESTRNIFVDQLNYPKDLTQSIEDGDIPSPDVYLKFDDTDNLAANSGIGGDGVVSGATAGSDVDPNA